MFQFPFVFLQHLVRINQAREPRRQADFAQEFLREGLRRDPGIRVLNRNARHLVLFVMLLAILKAMY